VGVGVGVGVLDGEVRMMRVAVGEELLVADASPHEPLRLCTYEVLLTTANIPSDLANWCGNKDVRSTIYMSFCANLNCLRFVVGEGWLMRVWGVRLYLQVPTVT